MCVAGVLIVTAAATHEIRTARRNSNRGTLDYLVGACSGKPGSLFDERCLDPLALQHEWHKDDLTRAMLVSRHAREAIAPVDQFFDGELQGMILMLSRRCQLSVADSAIENLTGIALKSFPN